MEDTFTRTLTAVVSGSRQLEEFASAIVSAAVEDAMLCVARDYGHNYSALIDRYRDALVIRHATSGIGKSTCAAPLRGGTTRCTRRAVCRGYCSLHSKLGVENEAKSRVIKVHQMTKAPAKDPVEAAMRAMGVSVVPAASWIVRPSDTTSLL